MGRKPNPNAPICPYCARPMHSRGNRWRCPVTHRPVGPPTIGTAPMTNAERQRRYKAKRRKSNLA